MVGLTRKELEYHVMKDRVAGASVASIAGTYRISHKRVNSIIESVLMRTPVMDARKIKLLELQRLDELFKAAYSRAIEGNLAAIETCLKVMDRRARYLGLDNLNDDNGVETVRTLLDELVNVSSSVN